MYDYVWDHDDDTSAHLSMHSGPGWIEVQNRDQAGGNHTNIKDKYLSCYLK